MRNGAIASLLVVAILAGAGAGYLVGVNLATNSTTNSSVATTSCTVLGPTIGVVIQIIEGGLSGPTSPVVGARIIGEAAGYCNNALQTQPLQQALTNSSGWATLFDGGFGVYNLNVSYEVGSPQVTETYHLSISMQPETTAYVVFNTTTGNVTTHFHYSI